MRARATAPRLIRAVSIVSFLSTPACRTREEAARIAGREAAQVAASTCGADASDDEACRTPICRDHCAPYADSKLLSEACLTKCLGQGTCDSDSDCSGGLVCMMIAPRLRRCQPRTDANW